MAFGAAVAFVLVKVHAGRCQFFETVRCRLLASRMDDNNIWWTVRGIRVFAAVKSKHDEASTFNLLPCAYLVRVLDCERERERERGQKL